MILVFLVSRYRAAHSTHKATKAKMSANKRRKLELLNTASDGIAISPSPSRTEFMDMNDECLLNVFKYLSPHGLNAIASTCTHLRVLARLSFAAEDANKSLDLPLMVKLHLPESQAYIESFLRNFGDLIREMDMPLAGWLPDDIFNLAVKYCGGGTVEKLRIHGYTPNSLQINAAHELFGHLKSIQCKEWVDGNETDVMAVSKNCNEIIVHPTPGGSATALYDETMRFANLEKVSIFVDFDRQFWLANFLNGHQRLIYLKLDHHHGSCTDPFNLAALWPCKQLQYLVLTGPRFEFTKVPIDLPGLKHLQITRLAGAPDGISKFIKGLLLCSLQHLVIDDDCLIKSKALQNVNVQTNLQKLVIKVARIPLVPNFKPTELKRLQNLNKFELIFIRNSVGAELYLNNLAATDTLTELTMRGGIVNAAFIEALGRLKSLRVLRLRAIGYARDITAGQWSKFKDIETLKIFEYYGGGALRLLQRLGATNSMEGLSMDYGSGAHNKGLLRAIGRFGNLRILELKVDSAQSAAAVCSGISALKKLEQFKLSVYRNCRTTAEQWESLKSLFETMPSLRIIKGVDHMDLKTYNDLIDIARQMNKKLVIVLRRTGSFENVPFDLVEKNRHIVNVYFEKETFFDVFEQ